MYESSNGERLIDFGLPVAILNSTLKRYESNLNLVYDASKGTGLKLEYKLGVEIA